MGSLYFGDKIICPTVEQDGVSYIVDNYCIEPTYIKDGLILHLDGIDKGGDSNSWVDLVGGNQFMQHNCVSNKDNIEFNGKNSYMKGDFQLPLSDSNAKSGTMEIAYEKQSFKSVEAVLMPPSTNMIAFAIYKADMSIIATGAGNDAVRYVTSGKHTFSYNQYGGYDNMKSTLRGSELYLGGTDGKWWIGCRSGNKNFFQGKVYSVRIYNRLLSKEEILYNQQIDIDRFFGGVNNLTTEDLKNEII